MTTIVKPLIVAATGSTLPDGKPEAIIREIAEGEVFDSSATQGEQGIQGEKGDTGDIGPTGLTGETGAAGATGTAGNDGADGTNGSDGVNGTDGADGTNGTDGTNGSDGVSITIAAVADESAATGATANIEYWDAS